MTGCYHVWCNGHELGQTLADGKEQGGLACYSPWGRKESDMTGQLNNKLRNSISKNEAAIGATDKESWEENVTSMFLSLAGRWAVLRNIWKGATNALSLMTMAICIYSVLWPPEEKNWLIWKDPDAGKDWRQEEKGMTEDEMVRWHHRLNGYGFGWTPGVGNGQGGLACCSPWGRKESDTTEQLNWTERKSKRTFTSLSLRVHYYYSVGFLVCS